MNRVQDDSLPGALEAELAPEFRLLRLLGEGAVARVYSARETGLERLVAVKVLRSELMDDDRVAQRFSREARSAARIIHPNVVTVHRVGSLSDGVPYIVMEYVPGRTLADLLAGGALPETARSLAILAQVDRALAAAHRHGVVHRDVRPGNILLEARSERTVLTDFGIAGIMETGGEVVTHLTRAGEALGDPRYASPEQLLAEPVTEAADVYSLGVLGYELLAGQPPFSGATDPERVAAKLRDPPPRLVPTHPHAVPPGASALLERCLARRPEQRPLAGELARSLEPAAAEAPAPGPGQPLRPVGHGAAIPLLSGFLSELRRRRVYRTAAAYLAGMIVLLEGSSLVLPALSAPDWLYRALVLLVVGAFPGVLALSWAFDVTPSGISRTEAVEADAAGSRGRAVLGAMGMAASIAIAGLLLWWLL